jgi:hypothetical protein
MPYKIRKQKCKQSSGKRGTHVLSYTDKKGKKHRACHTSRKKARGQIAAIEAESVERNSTMQIRLSELRQLIREAITTLMSPEGKEAAFLAAPTKKDAKFFLSKDELEKHVFSIPGGYDDDLLYDTLENMLVRDDNLKKDSPLKLDPEFRRYIEEKVVQWHMSVDPGRGEGTSGGHELKLKKFIRDTINGLYQQEIEQPSKYIAGYGKQTEIAPELQVPMYSKQTPKFLESISISDLRKMIKEIVEEEKELSDSKHNDELDIDKDGDVDSADYKMRVYVSGGIPKEKAYKMSRKYDKK